MYFKDEELEKWKVGDLRKYLLQRGVPIDNNVCKAYFNEKVPFAKKFDLPIQPGQESEKEILNAKHNKLSIDGVKYLIPMTSKKIGSLEVNTYKVLFWIILMKMQNWIRQRKIQGKEHCFLAMWCQLSLTRMLMKILAIFGSAFIMMAQFWQVSRDLSKQFYVHFWTKIEFLNVVQCRWGFQSDIGSATDSQLSLGGVSQGKASERFCTFYIWRTNK